jgi:hypothetical protein
MYIFLFIKANLIHFIINIVINTTRNQLKNAIHYVYILKCAQSSRTVEEDKLKRHTLL